MPSIKTTCKGPCNRQTRFSMVGYARYDGLCRRCYKAKTGKPRPITGRTKVRKPRTSKAAAPQPKGKGKGK